METQLAKIAQIAIEKPKEKFTSLIHLINESSLTQYHYEMKANKASGVDKVTKEEYQENLDSNIKELIAKMKRQAYKPQPVRRVYILKEGSEKLRRLEIAEDKTKIVAFGKNSLTVKEGQSKPGTFDFVGFTHYCGKSKMGKFRVKRKTSKKKYRISLSKVKKWVKENRNLPSQEFMNNLRVKLNGYFRYYGVTDNSDGLTEAGYPLQWCLWRRLLVQPPSLTVRRPDESALPYL